MPLEAEFASCGLRVGGYESGADGDSDFFIPGSELWTLNSQLATRNSKLASETA